jgi:hypothetical protein
MEQQITHHITHTKKNPILNDLKRLRIKCEEIEFT